GRGDELAGAGAEPVADLPAQQRGQENGGAVLDRQRHQLRLALAGLVQRVADGRAAAANGRAAEDVPGRARRLGHGAVALGADRVDRGGRRAVVPLVGDDAVVARRPAGGQRGVAGGGQRARVGVVTVAIPGPVLLQPPEAARAVELLPAAQVVAAHLIE